MAISASSVTPSNSLEEFRIEFNNLVTDVTGITSTNTFSTAIVFEGATADDYETTLTLTDPTADRTITLPNITGTVLVGTQANPDSADGAALGSASLEWSDLFLADGGQILFGNDQEITLSHNADNGLILKHVGTSDGIEPSLTFQAGDTDIAINDVLGSIFFQAPDEGSGTDAILIAAGIEAVSEGDFSASNNATKLSFLTAASELASEKMSLSSGGNLALPTDGTVLSFGADSDVTLTHAADTSLTLNLMMAATTFEPSGDTASGDNAAIGYTSAEGLILTGQGSTSDITFKNDADTTVFTIPTGTDDILFPDDAKILMGAASDLQIYHDGSQSYIRDTATGSLRLTANAVLINNANDDDAIAKFIEGGAVELYYSDTKHLETVSGGGTLTGSWAVTTSLNPDASDGATLGTTSLEWSDLYLADGAVIGFGDDQDVTLTHMADTGLQLSGSRQFQFGDSGTYIHQSADGVLDLVSDTEIEINATTIDVNGNLDVSGTYTGGGLMTTGGNIVIPDAGNIGSASDTNAITISSGGVVAVTATTANTSASDGALTVAGGAGIAADLSVGDDLRLISDGAQIYFGANSEVTVTHAHNAGLEIKHTATGDDNPAVLTLATGETDIAASDVIGSIRYQAPDEGTGTDAILVGAAIDAISEGDFSSSNNATKLAFRTGASETATEKMSLSSAGNLALSTDAAVLNFGADSDVNLTHVADTGLLLNSTRQLQFNDASQYISGASATKMDIRATDEIELTSTLVDVVGALTVSGTTTLNGALVLGDAAADTLTVNATLQGASPLTFEGGTADGYETTFAITDPTADRTITFPNKSMTVAGLDDVTALAIALG